MSDDAAFFPITQVSTDTMDRLSRGPSLCFIFRLPQIVKVLSLSRYIVGGVIAQGRCNVAYCTLPAFDC